MAGQNKNLLSREEIDQRLKALTPKLRRKLIQVGDHLADGLDCSGEDLFQEATTRALRDGVRHWPAEAPLDGFLFNVMRSLADARRRALQTDVVDCAQRKNDERFLDALLSLPADTLDDPSQRWEQAQRSARKLARLEELFANDPHVLTVITARALGEEKPETLARTGLSEKDYLAALKRLERRKGEFLEDD